MKIFFYKNLIVIFKRLIAIIFLKIIFDLTVYASFPNYRKQASAGAGMQP